MAQKTPAIDFPTRQFPLTGQELLIKQNKPDDGTPNPKEEMIPTGLISDLALNKIDGLSIDGNVLSLNITDKPSLDVDLSDLSNKVISGDAVNNVLTLYLQDGSTVEVDVSSISGAIPSFYRSTNAPNSGFMFFSSADSITTAVTTTPSPLSTISSIYVPNQVRLYSFRYFIDPAILGSSVTIRIYDYNTDSGNVYNTTDFTAYYPSITFVSYLSYQQNTTVVPNFQYVTNPTFIGANINMRRITNPASQMLEMVITGLNSPVQLQATF